jgi:hypothetical protein
MTIKEVYEVYRHLDECLSDREWLGEDLLSQILFELWEAIRDDQESDK